VVDRNDQQVHRGDGVYVLEGDHLVVLVDNFRRGYACNNPAEDTFWFHGWRVFPVKARLPYRSDYTYDRQE
jgi:hypothetical protein